jgi:glycosyltransferase involved in cell wall biosynthesis
MTKNAYRTTRVNGSGVPRRTLGDRGVSSLTRIERILGRPPRVLLVAEAATSHTHKWARYFDEQGYDVTVVSQSAGNIQGIRTIRFPPDGAWWTKLPRVRFGGGWQRWLAGWPRWRQILKAVAPDIVHVHFIPGEARDYFYYRGFPRLVVSTYGADVVFERDAPPSPATVRRVTSLLNQATRVTALSEFLEVETRKYLGPDSEIPVIPFGVDCDQFQPPPMRDYSTSKTVVLGFIKQLSPKYGPEYLLEAFAKIHAKRPATKLIFAGGGVLEPALRRRTKELGLSAHVEFVGRQPHAAVPNLMHQLDVFVMPSTYESETFGVAAVEASACGLPVVATAVGGVPEAVADGQTGLLVPPRDSAALAAACLTLIDQPARRQSMGAAGRRFALARYNWQNTAAKMRLVYESLLTEPAE